MGESDGDRIYIRARAMARGLALLPRWALGVGGKRRSEATAGARRGGRDGGWSRSGAGGEDVGNDGGKAGKGRSALLDVGWLG